MVCVHRDLEGTYCFKNYQTQKELGTWDRSDGRYVLRMYVPPESTSNSENFPSTPFELYVSLCGRAVVYDSIRTMSALVFVLLAVLLLVSLVQFSDAFQQISAKSFLCSVENAKVKTIQRVRLVGFNGDIVGFSNVADTSTNGTSEPTSTAATNTIHNFGNFDYNSHWYPVIWERDLVPNRPTKITLFDVDYVIAKTGEEGAGIMALVDACPHKSAALSEGRITSCGSFQCAYHGWTFHGSTGQCLSIPQVGALENQTKARATSADRTNARAIPAQSVQGMVFIFPAGSNLVHQHPPPPRIPELENYGTSTNNNDYRIIGPIIRDFPIDWTVLVENIMDPDHGVFAHQAKGFDFYSASREHAQDIVQDVPLNDGKGWTITSHVDAVYKVLAKPHQLQQNKRGSTPSDKRTPFQATTRYVAPSTIWMGRIHSETNQTVFFNVFYVTPTGTGKSRFMAASYAKVSKFLPLPPRWLTQVAINNFLDQDTQLLATQQRYVLATESQLTLELDERRTSTNHTDGTNRDLLQNLPVRKTLYTYRSPSERLGVRLGAFFDATVHRAPNRLAAIRALGGYDRVLQQAVPPREVVLDRYQQHTVICPDSTTFLNNCHKVRQLFQYLAILPILIPLLLLPTIRTATITTTVYSSSNLLLCAIQRIYTKSPGLPIAISLVSALISHVAKKLTREFYFKYDSSFRNRDLDKIPKLKPDSY